MSNCNCHTEINPDGSGQLSRYLKALDPSYVPIDDRSIADLLVYAKRYAAQIRFYDMPGTEVDDQQDETKISWRDFFRRDMAVVVASIGVVDVKQIKESYDEIREDIDRQASRSLFAELFRPIIGMATRIDQWYSLAIPDNPLHTDLDLAIKSTLKIQLKKIRQYEKGFSTIISQEPLELDYSAINDHLLWGLDEYVSADTSIYQGDSDAGRMRYAALYIDDVFNAFYGFITHLINISGNYLEYAIEQYPAHQPHMALFIAFLRIFKVAQNQLNGLSEKMLDFYYRDVLQLTGKPSLPDRAYIIFELAKNVVVHDVAAGTALKAGKDAGGREQVYKTSDQLMVNEAKVKELKTIFIDKAVADQAIQGIYARPIANSSDGFGEKFIDPSGKWPTFGKGAPQSADVKNICQAIDQYTELDGRKDQAQIGFAVASPQLLLQSGNRLIKMRIPLSEKKINKLDISIWMTAEDGWLQIKQEDRQIMGMVKDGIFRKDVLLGRSYFFNQEKETLYIFLPVAEKGIVAFDDKLHKDFSFFTPYPVMQIIIGPDMDIQADLFKNLESTSIAIDVQVGSINPFVEGRNDNLFLNEKARLDGLTMLRIANDDGPVTPGKPFDPFTAYPQQGSNFTIGSNEVFNKPVDELTINMELVSPANNEKDQMILYMSHARILQGLFGVSILAKGQNIRLIRPDEERESFTLDELTQNILLAHKGILADRYPIIYQEELIDNSYKGFITITNLLPIQFIKRDKGLFEIMQELAKLLKIRKISVNYHSQLSQLDSGTDQFFHVYPFGVVETYFGAEANPISMGVARRSLRKTAPRKASFLMKQPAFNELDKQKDYLLVDAKRKLLPQFTYKSPYSGGVNVDEYEKLLNYAKIDWKDEIVPRMIEASGLKIKTEGSNNQYSTDLQEQGMLFIGLEKLQPLQNITLLFQFAEGSAADEDNDPPPIHWSYLSFNEWKPLRDENLIADGTGGFRTTGIIKIETPADASAHNTIITDGLIWFCASVTEHANRIPMLIDVVAQAVEAKFEDNDNDASHFDLPLKAGSIGKLVMPVAEIDKLSQPFASFDGKRREVGKEFYTRVSERLRHKGRAITAWDYEHLVLDRFPSIYKVKCVTHSDPDCFCRHPQELTIPEIPCCGPQVAPGHVLIIPIADLKNRNAVNPLQPKTSRRTLLDIEKYIRARTSAFVRVHVKNPVYEQVLVCFKVKFYPGIDKGFYLKKLNGEIVQYLTPWAFDANEEVKFGQKIYASAVINFIEEREYVDFITDFMLFVCRDECCLPLIKAAMPVIGSAGINATLAFAARKINGLFSAIKGQIIDKTTGAGITGVSIAIKGTTIASVTGTDGSFSLALNLAHPILVVSLYEHAPVQIKPVVAGNTSVDIDLVKKPPEEGVAPGSSGIAPFGLNADCGCSGIEQVLTATPSFKGETVATPATARSILVSVPQHIIIPYEEPDRLTPCEERKLRNAERGTAEPKPVKIALPVTGAVKKAPRKKGAPAKK